MVHVHVLVYGTGHYEMVHLFMTLVQVIIVDVRIRLHQILETSLMEKRLSCIQQLYLLKKFMRPFEFGVLYNPFITIYLID